MFNNFYTQFWLSWDEGLVFDIYPFLAFKLHTSVLVAVTVIAVALRVRKVSKSKKRRIK